MIGLVEISPLVYVTAALGKALDALLLDGGDIADAAYRARLAELGQRWDDLLVRGFR